MFYCSYSGGVPRAPSSSSPLRTIGPAQSAERVWPKKGSEGKGRSLSASLREACSGGRNERTKEKLERKGVQFRKQSGFRGVLGEASKRANEGFVKRFSMWKQSLSRHARVFEASERRRHSVGSAGRDAEPACTLSLHFWQEGGCLHVESAFLGQWERRPARRVGDRLL